MIENPEGINRLIDPEGTCEQWPQKIEIYHKSANARIFWAVLCIKEKWRPEAYLELNSPDDLEENLYFLIENKFFLYDFL